MKNLKEVIGMRETQNRNYTFKYTQLGAQTLPTQNSIIIIIT